MASIIANNSELFFEENDLIISKTCLKGNIRYANRAFMAISGFSEQELRGKPHNIIRHPDMPKGVFRLMWKTLQQGEEFFGFVKNLCIDGSFYWVFANITQDVDSNGTVQGYYSVRRKPLPKVIHNVIEPLYQRMLDVEAQYQGPEALERSVQLISHWLEQEGVDYNQAMITLYQHGQIKGSSTNQQKDTIHGQRA